MVTFTLFPLAFGHPVAHASLFLLLAWVYAPFVLAGVYWFVLVRLRRVDLLRVTLEAAPLAFLLYAGLMALALFTVTFEDTGNTIMSTVFEAAIFPVVIVILAVTFGQLFARWNLAPPQDSLPRYSGIGMFVVVPSVIVGSVFLLAWIWFFVSINLSSYPIYQSGAFIVVSLIFLCAPTLGFIAFATLDTLLAISPRTPTLPPSPVTFIGGALSALGGTLAAIGFFRPWYELSGGIFNVDLGDGKTIQISTVQPTGADLAATSAPTLLGGMLILGIAALAIPLGIAGVSRQAPRLWLAVLLVGSVICAAIVGSELSYFSSHPLAYFNGRNIIFLDFRNGAWLTMIGLGLTICASLLLLFPGRWSHTISVAPSDGQPSAT
jgi:hypothetical protein